MAFIYADFKPESLEGYPPLQHMNFKIREFFGMDVSRSHDSLGRYSEGEDAKKIILKDDVRARTIERACGEQPKNPWSMEKTPSDEDMVLFAKSSDAWRECARRVEGELRVRAAVQRIGPSISIDNFHEAEEGSSPK
jgi:hypothetical protein